MPRLIFILIALLVTAGVGLGVYFLFFQAKPPVLRVDEGVSFGTSDEYAPQGDAPLGEVGEMEVGAGEIVAPRLIKITNGPVAFGSVAFPVEIPDPTSTSTPPRSDVEVRYVERASGNVYGYRINERTLTRLSNRTLPGIYEASWLSDGSMVYARFLSEAQDEQVVETYALPIQEGEGGYFLEPGLSNIVVNDRSTVATLLPSSSGSIATVAGTDGTGVKNLFSSPLTSLRLFVSGNQYMVQTSAAAQTGGYSFMVGSSGKLERVLGPLRGLMLLPSPSGSQLFYTYLSGTALRSELLELSSRVSTPIPLSTMAEKCVWATNEESIYCAVPRALSGSLPDDWYQGAVSFSDRLWKVDLAARVAVLVVDPMSVGDVSIDAVNLTLDENESVLVFTNKKDGSLWVYDL